MSTEEYALGHGLQKVGARPTLVRYIADAVRRVDFAYTLAKYTKEAGNARSRLGSWWNVLLPTLQDATYGLIFGLILGDSRPDNFLPFLFTGVFLFSFIQGSFSGGAGAIISNSGLVKSLSFPRVLLPLSIVISQTLTLLPQLLVLAVVLVAVQQTISFSWLMIIPLIMVMVFFNLGLAMIMARITVHLRDVNKLVPFVSRILFYVSGVFFSVDKIFSADSIYAQLIKLNPIYDFLNLARSYLVVGFPQDASLWIPVLLWSVGVFLFGLIFFWGAEERYGRDF